MNQQIQRRYVARNADPWAHCGLMHDKCVVIEPQPCADVPIAAMPLVLHISGWLNIPAPCRKLELLQRAWIELRRIGDGVLQRFMHRTENPVHSGFPVVMPTMAGNVSTNIS